VALFGRMKEIHGGAEGVATIVESETRDSPGHSSDAGAGIVDLLVDSPFGGTRPYRLVLEVDVPGREPFKAEGSFDVPNKAERLGPVGGGTKLQPGVRLPVRVDDDGSVRIDWKAYMEMPDRKERHRAADQQATHAQMGREAQKKHAKDPEHAAKERAVGAQVLDSYVQGVKGGAITREQFEEQARMLIAVGRATPEDVEARRAELDR